MEYYASIPEVEKQLIQDTSFSLMTILDSRVRGNPLIISESGISLEIMQNMTN